MKTTTLQHYCKKCKETKDISLFVPNSTCKDGYTYVCKKCERKQRALHKAQLTPEQQQQYKKYQQSYYAKNKGNYAKWRQANPDKIDKYKQAHKQVYKTLGNIAINITHASPSILEQIAKYEKIKQEQHTLQKPLEELTRERKQIKNSLQQSLEVVQHTKIALKHNKEREIQLKATLKEKEAEKLEIRKYVEKAIKLC